MLESGELAVRRSSLAGWKPDLTQKMGQSFCRLLSEGVRQYLGGMSLAASTSRLMSNISGADLSETESQALVSLSKVAQ